MSGSLLDYLDCPILVGDPDGRAVYLNPSFESCFATSAEAVRGQPLSAMFEGGAREAILRAVADVCGGGGSIRFLLREAGLHFAAVASPISAESGRVGVIILLTEERAGDERLTACERGFAEPVEELTRCLHEFQDQIGGRRAERYRVALEDAARALEEIRKRTEELHNLLSNAR